MAPAVDEEGRGPGDAAEVGGVHVRNDLVLPGPLAYVPGELVGVEAELSCMPDEVLGCQLVLVKQELVVQLPEFVLS